VTGGPTYLGVDAGTSVVKAVLLDDSGSALMVHGRDLGLQHGDGDRVEQDADEVLRAVGEVVRAVLEQAGSEGHAAPGLVAVTAQGDGCWLVDADHRPVRPAVSWLDGRAAGLLADWTADGVTERVYRLNGSTLFPGAPAPVLAWLDQHEPEALDRAESAGYCKDVILGRLTGLRATDPSDSSVPFGDGTGQAYSDEILRLCGLGHRRDLLAPIESPAPQAAVHDDGAQLTGLDAGTPVVAGPFDFPACASGAGVDEPGDGLLIVGTTLGCLVHVDALQTSGDPAGFSVATGQPGRWLRAMPAMVGTASMDWMLRTVGLGVTDIEPALADSPPGAAGVEVLPYFATSGERAPFVDPHASGQVTGVRLTTTRNDLVRAVCEGLAYAARHCFEVAGHSGRVVACGGGTGSPGWLQVFADVLGTPIQLARTPEVGARGAVLSALRARGDEVDAATWTAPQAEVEPDPGRAARYDDGYQRYLEHVRVARPFWATRIRSASPEPAATPATGYL
jgi:erythritol kinase (D-erythritol 1-phosphate-forming)